MALFIRPNPRLQLNITYIQTKLHKSVQGLFIKLYVIYNELCTLTKIVIILHYILTSPLMFFSKIHKISS